MILDAHTHVFPQEVCRRREDYFSGEPAFRLLYADPRSRLVDPEEMVAALAEEGVDAAVVCGFPWHSEHLLRRHHEVILEAMRRWPDKLIGFCAVNPLEPGAVREVERCLAQGFRGVGELAWYADSPGEDLGGLPAIAELCQHFRVPLMLHTNDPVGAAYPGKAKKETPEVFRNVYFDTAASPYLYRPVIYRLAAEMVGPDKILFGSDYPLLPPSRYFKEMEEAALPEDWREMLLGKNLARILNLH